MPTRARVFIVFAFGFFVSYLFRTVNAVLAPDLTSEIGLQAGALGALTAAYFLTFAAFQPMLGMLLDRFGPRRVEAGLLLVAVAGAAMFAVAETLSGLVVARALIGLGVSACLMAGLKALVQWFPRESLPLANGAFLAAGSLGAVAAGTPVELALGASDWRTVFFGLAALTAAVALLIFIAAPDRHDAPADVGFAAQMAGLKDVYGSAFFWRIAPLTMLQQGAFMAFQGLWAAPWLVDVDGLDRLSAANHVALIAGAMALGYLVVGLIAGRLQRFGIRPALVGGTGMGLFIGVQILILAGTPLPSQVLWAIYGFLGSTGVVSYAVLTQGFDARLAGRVNTALTLTMFGSAFAFQWGIGEIVAGFTPAGASATAAGGYRAAMLLAIVLQAAAFVWYVLPRRRPDAATAKT